MAAHVRTVVVAEADRQELQRRARSKDAPARVVELTLTEPPTEYGLTHWSSRLLAQRLAAEGTPISHVTIARIWHRFGVQPWRAQTFKFSTDPQLEAKIRDVVGLYLHPRAGSGDRVGCDPGAPWLPLLPSRRPVPLSASVRTACRCRPVRRALLIGSTFGHPGADVACLLASLNVRS